MITNTDLERFNCDNILQYSDLLVESVQNGQFTQLREMVEELSKSQKKAILKYLITEGLNCDHKFIVADCIITFI